MTSFKDLLVIAIKPKDNVLHCYNSFILPSPEMSRNSKLRVFSVRCNTSLPDPKLNVAGAPYTSHIVAAIMLLLHIL
jgi:hypothetical protein